MQNTVIASTEELKTAVGNNDDALTALDEALWKMGYVGGLKATCPIAITPTVDYLYGMTFAKDSIWADQIKVGAEVARVRLLEATNNFLF